MSWTQALDAAGRPLVVLGIVCAIAATSRPLGSAERRTMLLVSGCAFGAALAISLGVVIVWAVA